MEPKKHIGPFKHLTFEENGVDVWPGDTVVLHGEVFRYNSDDTYTHIGPCTEDMSEKVA